MNKTKYHITQNKKFVYHVQKTFWYHGYRIEKTIFRSTTSKYFKYCFSFKYSEKRMLFFGKKKYLIEYLKNPKFYHKKYFGKTESFLFKFLVLKISFISLQC